MQIPNDISNFCFFTSVFKHCLVVCKAVIPLALILAKNTSNLNLKAKGLFHSWRLVLWEKY